MARSSSTPTAVWNVIEPPAARDGDSVYLVRERIIEQTKERVLTERDPDPELCRLTWLKTPEISGPYKDPIGGPMAKADCQSWLDEVWAHWGPELLAVQYGEEKYGRPLVDVRTPDGQSLSIWMTEPPRNWPVYS